MCRGQLSNQISASRLRIALTIYSKLDIYMKNITMRRKEKYKLFQKSSYPFFKWFRRYELISATSYHKKSQQNTTTTKFLGVMCQCTMMTSSNENISASLSFVRGIHRGPVNSPYKGQWRWSLMFPLICVWINGWVNNLEAGDLRRYRAHYDVTLMPRTGWITSPMTIIEMNVYGLIIRHPLAYLRKCYKL